jgi:hypothetical protein
LLVDRDHPVLAAGDIDQVTGRAQAEAAGVGDPPVITERPGELAVGGEAEQRAITVAVRATGARDQDSRHDLVSSVCAR